MMNDQELFESAKTYVKEILGDETTGHDYFHAMRVYNMAMYLSIGKEVDELVVGLAALLHDLDDEKINKDKHHTENFFVKNPISELQKSQIFDIIRNMSFHKHLAGKRVASLEGKIVQDADRLDALGAIGIARVFAYSGKTNRPIFMDDIDDDSAIAHFYRKLFLLPDLMNLEESKIIANDRLDFMKEYLNKFYEEWNR